MKRVKHQTIPVDGNPCERGSAALRPVLYVHAAASKPGLLIVPLADGVEIRVRLARRHVNTLLVVLGAWQEQSELPAELRGYRTAEELAELFAGMPGSRGVLVARTTAAYIHEIRKAVRKQIAKRFGADGAGRYYEDLFETSPQRGLGYRMGKRGLVVVVEPERS